MDMRIWGALLVALSLGLAGCADDGGDDDGDPDPTGTGTTTTTTTTSPMPMPGTPMYVNGTVSGVADCALVASGAPPTGGDSQQLPPGVGNGTYELTRVGGSGSEALCLYFDDGTTGASGTIPAAATSFTVYADRAPTSVGYSVAIQPPA